MPSLIEAYQFGNIPAYTKPKSTLDALVDIEPLLEKSAKGIKDYQDQQGRRNEIDEAIANGKGYEWFDAEDPAMTAIIDEYVRTGNSSGIANARNAWETKQKEAQAKADAATQAQKAEGYSDLLGDLRLTVPDLYAAAKAEHPDYTDAQLKQEVKKTLVANGAKGGDAANAVLAYVAPAADKDTSEHDEDYANAEVEVSTIIADLTALDPKASAATIMKDAAQKLCNDHPNLSKTEALKIVKSAVTEEKILAAQQANTPKTPKNIEPKSEYDD